MPRPSNSEARRAQITRALMKVMAKRGYDGASVADIAKAAKLTPGLVHYHFESKQEILLELLASLVARHEAGLEARLAALDDAWVDSTKLDSTKLAAAFKDHWLGDASDDELTRLLYFAELKYELVEDYRGEFVQVDNPNLASAAMSALMGAVQSEREHRRYRRS